MTESNHYFIVMLFFILFWEYIILANLPNFQNTFKIFTTTISLIENFNMSSLNNFDNKLTRNIK